jgi:hypothetical protein
MKKTNPLKAFAEAKLPANKRSKFQQKRFAEFCESKRLNLNYKSNPNDCKS